MKASTKFTIYIILKTMAIISCVAYVAYISGTAWALLGLLFLSDCEITCDKDDKKQQLDK